MKEIKQPFTRLNPKCSWGRTCKLISGEEFARTQIRKKERT